MEECRNLHQNAGVDISNLPVQSGQLGSSRKQPDGYPAGPAGTAGTGGTQAGQPYSPSLPILFATIMRSTCTRVLACTVGATADHAQGSA